MAHSSIKNPVESTDVLIVGGGPCGLAAAVALGRCGVRTVLVEKHPSTSYHPRGHVVNARSMEILRTWGLEDEVRERGIPHDRNRGVAFVRSVAGETIGELRRYAGQLESRLTLTHGPSAKTSCPQDVIEPVLRRGAEALRAVSVRFGARLTSLSQDDDGVDAAIATDAGEYCIRAKYAIAADGARGAIREWLDIPLKGEGALGHQIGAYFEADLWPWVADRPNLLWWVYNSETVGVLIALDGRRRWTYNFGYNPEKQSPEDFTPERCARIVRSAIGVKDLDVTVRDVRVWRMQARIAEQLRAGRIFLAGDAAHPLPPTGGQGMNTAIGDVHNLAWKLALVINGQACDGLLDTYQQERMPVIEFNVEQSVRNARKMEAAGLGGILRTQDDFREEDIARMRKSIPDQREHFEYDGQTYGYSYQSDLYGDDAARGEASGIHDYVPCAAPGHRAPHCWLGDACGGMISTVDLFKDLRFTLLAGREGHAWARAFRRAAVNANLDGHAYVVGSSGDLKDNQGAFLDLYGIGPDGAVLVRPDGHVAWRAMQAGADPDAELREVLSRYVGQEQLAEA